MPTLVNVQTTRRNDTLAGWRAICKDTRGGSSNPGQPITYNADFVIMSNGNFSRPSLPATYKARMHLHC
jgi:cation diffusion facilitator CzcD-associated flavoprotein CzcO